MSESGQDGQSRFGEIVAILSAASFLSTAAVALRSFTRLRMMRCFGRDDGTMVIAQILTVGSAVAIGLEARWGLGRHTWTVPPEHIVPYLKAFYGSILIYNMAVCLTKMSILLQYRRIFATPTVQRATKVCLWFMSAWTVTLLVLLAMPCVPVAAFWDKAIEGRCYDAPSLWYVMVSVNLVSDFGILIIPLPVLSSLQLPYRQKVMLMGVFCLGIFPCAISIYRIYVLRFAMHTQDPMWDNVDAATWSVLEVSVGVIAACLPTLRPIFAACMPQLFGAGSELRSRPNGAAPSSATGGGFAGESLGTSRERGANMFDDSNEALHKGRGLASEEDDIEFGALPTSNAEPTKTAGGTVAYNVSVVAGRGLGADEGYLRRGEIKTTTVVTQQITFGKQG